jgi:hypothetical protein
MRRLLLVFLCVIFLPARPVFAEPPTPPLCTNCGKVTGGDGALHAEYKRGTSERVNGRGDGSNGRAPGRTTWIEIDEDMAPTCDINTRMGDMVLCGQAVNTCPDGLIRFWVWHQVRTVTRNPDGTETSTVTTPWYQEDRTYCLGADDPGVPNIARVIDQIRSDFTSLPLRVQTPRADPAPTTLVNIPTAFSAGSSEGQTFTPTLLGVTVTVTAKPVRWIWTWGDGTTESFDRPGTPHEPDVTHEYKTAADRRASVVVEWRGTFRVGNDPTEYTIAQPAYVRSSPMTVRVRQARSQLVR